MARLSCLLCTAAFPATFHPVLDISCALDAKAALDHVHALGSLWLRSVLTTGRLLAAVQAAQSNSSVRGAYSAAAPLMAPAALATARAFEADLVAKSIVNVLAPKHREVALLHTVATSSEAGDWDAVAASELAGLADCWMDSTFVDTAPRALFARSCCLNGKLCSVRLQHWTM